MSFATALDAATALGAEWVDLESTISNMAVAADHDPKWNADDEATFNLAVARKDEVTRLLATAFVVLARDHRAEWQGFLATSIDRLNVVAEQQEKGRGRADYTRDQWARWMRGDLPASEQPSMFARGLRTLAVGKTS